MKQAAIANGETVWDNGGAIAPQESSAERGGTESEPYPGKAQDGYAEITLGEKKDASSSDEILSLEEMERRHILHALSICKGNRTEVCKRLGISRATLWRKLKELKIAMEEGDEQ